MSCFTYCFLSNPCSALLLFKDLMEHFLCGKIGNNNKTKFIRHINCGTAWVSMCIPNQAVYWIPRVVCLLTVPHNWISSTNLSLRQHLFIFWLDGVSLKKNVACLFLHTLSRSNHFSPLLLFCCLSFSGVTCQTLFYVCYGCEYVAVATSIP